MYFNIVAGILRKTLRPDFTADTVCHMQTSEQPSLNEKDAPCIKSESSAEAGYTKSTQTYNHPSVSVDMPEIVIENNLWNEHVQSKAKTQVTAC